MDDFTTQNYILFICICVYIHKYILTDLFLIHFQHWKRQTPHTNLDFLGGFLVILFHVKLKKKKMKQTSRITAARYLEEPASWQHLWDLKKKERKKKRQLFVDFDPPNCVAWHLCVWIQRDQKRLSSWHNHCFLSHKEQNLQLRGGKRKKKKNLFLYKGNFIPCLCTLLFCGLSYMETLTRQGKRQSRFTVREVELLAPW